MGVFQAMNRLIDTDSVRNERTIYRTVSAAFILLAVGCSESQSGNDSDGIAAGDIESPVPAIVATTPLDDETVSEPSQEIELPVLVDSLETDNDNPSVDNEFDNVPPLVDGNTTQAATLPVLSPPPLLPTRCIGAVNESGVVFCVNPDTREFSKTNPDTGLVWSFILPGENDSNEIESVLTVGDQVLLIADRFPTRLLLTSEQRANQYEVSVFEQSGAFLRTLPLSIDLVLDGSSEERQITVRGRDPFNGIKARVSAIVGNGSNSQLLFGWHGFRDPLATSQWDTAGLSRFDLVTGERIADRLYPQQQLNDLSIDPQQFDKVRVTTSATVEWLATETLEQLDDGYFNGLGQDQLIEGPRPGHTQINRANYMEIIDRVMPFVNAVPADDVFVIENELLSNSQVIDTFSTDQFDFTVSTCPPDGRQSQQSVPGSNASTTHLDNCRTDTANYVGTLGVEFIGRDGSSGHAEMTVHSDNDNVIVGTLTSGIGFIRVGDGRASEQSGTLLTYGRNAGAEAEALSSYSSNAQFFYFRDVITNSCASEVDENGNGRRLFCDRHVADGVLEAAFNLNASWTSYTNLSVSARFEFGGPYFPELFWFDTATGERLPEVPIPRSFLDRQEPPTEFVLNEGGELIIEASDGSMIVAELLSNDGESVTLSVTLLNEFGENSGIALDHVVNLRCEERLNVDDCVVPDSGR